MRFKRVFWRALRPFARITRAVRWRPTAIPAPRSAQYAYGGCHTYVWRDSANALRMHAKILMSSSWRRLGGTLFPCIVTTDADTRAQACERHLCLLRSDASKLRRFVSRTKKAVAFLADHVSDAGVHFPYALAHASGTCLHGDRRADRVQHAFAASAYVLTCQYQGRWPPMQDFDHASLKFERLHACTLLYILPAAILRLLSVCISHRSSPLLRGNQPTSPM